MKFSSSKLLRLNILFVAVLLAVSCDKESDLLTDYVLLDSLNSVDLGEYDIKDVFETDLTQSAIFNVPANDPFIDLETSNGIQTSAPLIGILSVAGENQIFNATRSNKTDTEKHSSLNKPQRTHLP